MAKQKQDDQLEHTYSSYVRIQDVTLKTCQRRWIIGRSGERGSGISVLVARHDDDDDDDDFFPTTLRYFVIIFHFDIRFLYLCFGEYSIIVASFCLLPILLKYCVDVMIYQYVAKISYRHYLPVYIFFWHSDFSFYFSFTFFSLSLSFFLSLPLFSISSLLIAYWRHFP